MLKRGEYLAAWLVVALTIAFGFIRLVSNEKENEKKITLRLESRETISLEESEP
ncbi:hypothetical protein IKS38_07465 [bacterium]|nr:hypothetical protein [bacterium]